MPNHTTYKLCPTCHGTGEERSGVCHCGEEIDSTGLFAHSGHDVVEMTRPCPTCGSSKVNQDVKHYRVILTRQGEEFDLYLPGLTEEELQFISVDWAPGDVVRVVEVIEVVKEGEDPHAQS